MLPIIDVTFFKKCSHLKNPKQAISQSSTYTVTKWMFMFNYKASWASMKVEIYPNTTGIFFLFLLCHAGYSPQLLITETSSWFSLIPAEMCESQASLNTQWDTSAVSDYEYIIHQKNLTLTDWETSSLNESWSNSPSALSHEWCSAESQMQHLQTLNDILALAHSPNQRK